MKQSLQTRKVASIIKLFREYPYQTAWMASSAVLALGIAMAAGGFVWGVITIGACGMISVIAGAAMKHG